MRIIEPYYTILSDINGPEMLKNIERAGRTCYKSEDRITDESAEKFINMLIKRNHESVIEHEKVSVLFVCDRGVSHELVRHRIASFSQESTRYCNYSQGKFDNQLTFIKPSFLPEIPDATTLLWEAGMEAAEATYKGLISCGWKPEEARSVLPNSLKTEIVVTANLREWRTIFKQRTQKDAHPQMRQLMQPLLNEFKSLIPIIFNDITY